MARDADSEQVTLSAKPVYREIVLCELQLDSGTLYFTTLDRNVEFDGDTYLGLGSFLVASGVKETAESTASGLQLELSGIDLDIIDTALDEEYGGRAIILKYGFLDENFQITAATGGPAILFQGLIDQMNVALGKTATITLTAEDDWIRWEEKIVSLYTNEEQQYLYPGDLGLEFVQQVVDKQILWGRV